MPEPLSAEVLRALGDPLRLAALVALEERERSPAELAAALGVAPEALGEHLAELAAGGLVVVGSGGGRLRAASRGWAEIAAQLRRLQDGVS